MARLACERDWGLASLDFVFDSEEADEPRLPLRRGVWESATEATV